MVIFFLNLHKKALRSAMLAMAVNLVLFAIFFKGSATSVCAAETLVPSFGTGPVKVRLFTDYFCPPCRAMEPKVEPILSELMKKSIVNVTFIDTPFSKHSVMYARHFLFILNEKKDFDLALLARSALNEAAVAKITDQARLEEYLKNKGMKLKPLDTQPTFDILNGYLRDDKVRATPTCVIEKDGKTEQYGGAPEIVSALEVLMKQEAPKNLNKKIERKCK